MNQAKIQFSQEELSLAENAELILTKNKIVGKICDLFSSLAVEMQQDVSSADLPREVAATSPKISRGENYKGLPWVVLDYPRLFTKENVFAVRTLFWWANYFSMTLHLKGIYKKMFLEKIKENISFFSDANFYVNINTNEWQHSLHENDYILLKHADAIKLENDFAQTDLLKLSVKVDLDQWNQAQQVLVELFGKIMRVLKN